MRSFVPIVLVALSGLACASAVAQPLQPTVWFWEPPITASTQLRPQFGPIVRVVICDIAPTDDTTALELVTRNSGTPINLVNGLGLGCGNPPPYGTMQIINEWIAHGWDGPGFSLMTQNAKLSQHKRTSLLGNEGWNDDRDIEKVDVAVDVLTEPTFPFVDSDSSRNDSRAQPWMLEGTRLARNFWTQYASILASSMQSNQPARPLSLIKRAHLDIEPFAFDMNGEIDDLRLVDHIKPRSAFILYALPLENQGPKPYFDTITNEWRVSNEAAPPGFDTTQNRWNMLPVPGFGTKSLSDLWGDVKPLFGNREYPLMLSNFVPGKSFYNANDPLTVDNRGVFLWWSGICSRALASAHSKSAIEGLQTSFPNVRGSNYDMNYVRPGQQDFGWHQKDPGDSLSLQNMKRLGNRGVYDANQHGANRVPVAGGEEWYLADNTDRTADFSAPVLYALGGTFDSPPQQTAEWYLQKDLYLRTRPLDSRWSASLRWHRWTLESIIATAGAGTLERGAESDPWLSICPWVAPPGGLSSLFGGAEYYATSIDTNRLLSLLRSKAIPEMSVFNPRDNPNDGYAAFDRVYGQVYGPQIIDIVNDEGGQTLAPGAYGAEMKDAVDDTNPRWLSGVATAKVLTATNTAPTGAPHWMTTKIQVKANVKPPTQLLDGCATLRFDFECDVTVNPGCLALAAGGAPNSTPCPTVPSALEGRIRINRPGQNALVMSIPDDFPQNNERYGFWAPATVPGSPTSVVAIPTLAAGQATTVPISGPYNSQMRRSFQIDRSSIDLASIIDSNGNITFDLLVRAVGTSAFGTGATITTKWDLIQIVWVDGPNCASIGEQEVSALQSAGAAGADVNWDDVVTTDDLSEFLAASATNAASADYNNNGIHDQDDVVEFLTDFAEEVE